MVRVDLNGLVLNVLVDVNDYEQSAYTTHDMIFTFICIYIALWILQFTINFMMSFVGGDICGDRKNRDIIARLSVDALSMFACCVFGYEGFLSLNGFEVFSSGSGFDRLYTYNPFVQRLLVFQMGYTFKTVGDAIVYSDGVISFCHHVATGSVVALALYPFLHPHGAFFVGLSEVSTVALCVVQMFMKDKGVGLLKERFPTFDLFMGLLFTLLFIVCRIMLWGFYSFYFWKDCLEILMDGTAHSVPAVIWYLFANFCLSLLQIFWLFEIFKGIAAIFGGDEKKKK